MPDSESILILNVQIPFTRGGAEVLCERLRDEMRARDYMVDILTLPFSALPKERIVKEMLNWRKLDVSEYAGTRVDRVIATKFPTYFVEHPNKVTWLIHQHRQAFELYDSRFGDFSTNVDDEALRQMILSGDQVALAEARKRFTISPVVSERLMRYLDITSEPLMPPLPLGSSYRSNGATGSYLLYVGRLCSIKRVDLLVRALPLVDDSLQLRIVGLPDEPGYQQYLESEVKKHHLSHRVTFCGRVSDEELLELYSECFAVCYAPHNEDYGFVTLEALASGKPVVTTSDSGCVLSFIEHEKNGLISQPDPLLYAACINRLIAEPGIYESLSSGAASSLPALPTWDEIITSLTS